MLRNLRHAESHADLQALDRLFDRAGERQAESRPIRLLQDDAHVLLRPGHAAPLGLGVHRPVLRAAVTQCLAQPLRVHAQRLTNQLRRLLGLGPVPGIAGRSASYLARQLYDMQQGMRKGPWVTLMQPVVDKMSGDDVVNVTAYVSSLGVGPKN